MPMIVHKIITGTTFECDAWGCETTLEAPVFHPDNRWSDGEKTQDYAQSHGWSRWYNRSEYFYCPQHGPKSPNLRQIW